MWSGAAEGDDVAAAVGRTDAAVRQLAGRARKHHREGAVRATVDPAEHSRAVETFLVAAGGGGLAGLVAALDPAVVLVSDGGGDVTAAPRPVLGADKVARFLLGIVAKVEPGDTVTVVPVDGLAGLLLSGPAGTTAVVSFTVADGRVTAVDLVRAPKKLGQSDRTDQRNRA